MGLAEFKARGIALGNLKHAYDFQETSGVPLDYSGTGRNGVVGTQGAINGDAILPGADRSFRMNLGAGAALGTGSIAVGHPLQLPSQEFTAVIIMRLDSHPTSGRRGIVERGTLWSIRAEPGGTLRAYITAGAGFSSEVRSRVALETGKTFLVAARRKPPQWELIVNGSLEGSIEWPGDYSTTSTTAITFASGGYPPTGNVQAWSLFDRGLSLGELRQLTVDADSGMDRQGVLFDYVLDEYDDLIAGSDHETYDGVTGGAMRAAEPYRLPADGWKRRPGPRAAVEMKPYVPITSTSDLVDYGNRSMLVCTQLLMQAAVRGNATSSVWHDGTAWVSPEMPAGSQLGRRQYGGVLAAIIARYLAGGGKGVRGLLPLNDYLHIAKKDLDVCVDMLDLPTSYRIADNEFALGAFADLVWETRGLLPDSMWSEYRDMYLEAAHTFAFGGPWSGGVEGNELTFYVNPNREIGEHRAYMTARNLWHGSGTNPWIAWADGQWEFMRNPPLAALYPTGRNDPLGRGYGEVLDVVPSNPDGRDGKGFYREHHGGGKGFYNIGATTDEPPTGLTRETIDVNGYDKNYTGTALGDLACLAVVEEEDRYLYALNLLRNRLRDNTNTSTWVIDATYGSRHTGNFAWNPAWDICIALRTPGGRDDISTTETAACFNSWVPGLRQGVRTNRQTYWGSVALSLGTIIRAQADYPE